MWIFNDRKFKYVIYSSYYNRNTQLKSKTKTNFNVMALILWSVRYLPTQSDGSAQFGHLMNLWASYEWLTKAPISKLIVHSNWIIRGVWLLIIILQSWAKPIHHFIDFCKRSPLVPTDSWSLEIIIKTFVVYVFMVVYKSCIAIGVVLDNQNKFWIWLQIRCIFCNFRYDSRKKTCPLFVHRCPWTDIFDVIL